MRWKLVVLSFPVWLFSLAAGQKQRVIHQDLNLDSIVDVLQVDMESGSGFGGARYTLIDGKSGDSLSTGYYSSYGQFLDLLPLGKQWLQAQNFLFLDALRSEFRIRHHADGSLHWLLDAFESRQLFSQHPLWQMTMSFEPHWQIGEIRIPASYAVTLDSLQMAKLAPGLLFDDFALNNNLQTGILLYRSHNHRMATGISRQGNAGASYRLLDSTAEGALYATRHGVISRRAGKWCWIFISDQRLNFGGEKLRWPSIRSAFKYGQLVFIHRRSGPDLADNVFVIDDNSGFAGLLRLDAVNERFDRMALHDDKLQLYPPDEGTEVYEMPLAKIVAAMPSE